MQESLMMIPECHRRLEKAMGELQNIVDTEAADLGETPEFAEAKKILTEAEEQLKANWRKKTKMHNDHFMLSQ